MGLSFIASDRFTRPADTTAYAANDLVANSTTAASVMPLVFAIGSRPNQTGRVRRVRLRANKTSLSNAEFRLHLYTDSPTCDNGDNGAWSTNKSANYIGSLDVVLDRAFNDGACGIGYPGVGSDMMFGVGTLYGLLEARAAYTPDASETLIVTLEAEVG